LKIQDKPSAEELADRMTRIREQNEKIKQRRLVSICLLNTLCYGTINYRMSKRMKKLSRKPKKRNVLKNVLKRLEHENCKRTLIRQENRTQSVKWTRRKHESGIQEKMDQIGKETVETGLVTNGNKQLNGNEEGDLDQGEVEAIEGVYGDLDQGEVEAIEGVDGGGDEGEEDEEEEGDRREVKNHGRKQKKQKWKNKLWENKLWENKLWRTLWKTTHGELSTRLAGGQLKQLGSIFYLQLHPYIISCFFLSWQEAFCSPPTCPSSRI
jgi:hypothetical protein